MKLVANSDSKCGELPAAETCGMDEDEEDQFDAVQFKESKGKKLLNKLKRIAGKVRNQKKSFSNLQFHKEISTSILFSNILVGTS